MNSKQNKISKTITTCNYEVKVIKDKKTYIHQIKLPIFVVANYKDVDKVIKRQYGDDCTLVYVEPCPGTLMTKTYEMSLDYFIESCGYYELMKEGNKDNEW